MYPLQIRIDGKDNRDFFLEIFKKNIQRYPKVLVGYENPISKQTGLDNPHHHLFILSTDENLKNRKQNARNLLKKHMPELKDNGEYAISQTYTKEFEKIGIYAVKDGNYSYYGFTEDEIENYRVQSYKKESITASYRNEFKELQVITDIPEYTDKLLDLRKKYDKNTTFNQLKNMVEWHYIKTDKLFEKRIKNRVLTDLGIETEHTTREYLDNEIIRETIFRGGLF